MQPRLAVIGLGLIGGSFARALRAAGVVGRISGYDLDPIQRNRALELGVIDHAAEDVTAVVCDADLVVLAVPVLQTGAALAACLPALKPSVVVTDVGSTKQSVLAEVKRVCGGNVPAWFVAGHPIAGTEKSGVANSITDLFSGHRVILTPHPGQSPVAIELVTRLWEATGARVVQMDAARHDAIFAATSHLPHVLAYCFVDMLARLPEYQEIFSNAGGGFRDFTRIASSSPQMWHDIVRANAGAVTQLLDRQLEELNQLRAMITAGDWDAMKALFERGRAARERYLTQIE
jgi:prephenate dehydrogenase